MDRRREGRRKRSEEEEQRRRRRRREWVCCVDMALAGVWMVAHMWQRGKGTAPSHWDATKKKQTSETKMAIFSSPLSVSLPFLTTHRNILQTPLQGCPQG